MSSKLKNEDMNQVAGGFAFFGSKKKKNKVVEVAGDSQSIGVDKYLKANSSNLDKMNDKADALSATMKDRNW